MSRRRASIVDLTTSPSRRRSSAGSPPLPSSSSSSPRNTTRRRSSQAEARQPKRRRVELGSPFSSSSDVTVEEPPIDLTRGPEDIRAKQTQDAIEAQQLEDPDKSHSVLGAYKCPICMDTPENATSTACGHLFCHQCIIECLNRADEQRVDSNKPVRGTCPVCRKSLTRNEMSGPRRSLVPIQLKLSAKKKSAVSPAA